MSLVLASQSPRRRELMHLVTDDFVVDSADIDESLYTADSPALLCCQLAQAKAKAVAQRHTGSIIIGCDTIVDVDGQALGKPHTPQEAADMLSLLSGRDHLVHTGICLLSASLPQPLSLFVESSVVCFAPLSEQDITWYISTGEPFDKAGGYGIQGAASRFIPRVEGCYFNVVGLPVAALYAEMRQLHLL